MKKLTFVLFLLWSAAANSWIGFYDSRELVNLCKRDQSECLSWIKGYVDAAAYMSNIEKSACTSSTVTNPDRADIFRETYLSYIKNHPELLDVVAGVTFGYAMQEAFPCPN